MESLPVINADSGQLSMVFQNLIGNAIKFRNDEPPFIHISSEKLDGMWKFAVTDNGSVLILHITIAFLKYSSVCTLGNGIRVPALDLPLSRRSLKGTEERSGWSRRWGKVPLFTSRSRNRIISLTYNFIIKKIVQSVFFGPFYLVTRK